MFPTQLLNPFKLGIDFKDVSKESKHALNKKKTHKCVVFLIFKKQNQYPSKPYKIMDKIYIKKMTQIKVMEEINKGLN